MPRHERKLVWQPTRRQEMRTSLARDPTGPSRHTLIVVWDHLTTRRCHRARQADGKELWRSIIRMTPAHTHRRHARGRQQVSVNAMKSRAIYDWDGRSSGRPGTTMNVIPSPDRQRHGLHPSVAANNSRLSTRGSEGQHRHPGAIRVAARSRHAYVPAALRNILYF